MTSKLLCTDVLAIRCVDNLIFVGIGCALHIFNANTYGLEKKLNCLYPCNIHGIIEGPNNKLAVFGVNCFCTYIIRMKQEALAIKEDVDKKCLDDWIIAAKWLTFQGCDLLAVLLAHNNIRIYDTYNNRYKDVWCEEKCILYTGSILMKNSKNLIIFSGTVFQEILIWEVNHIYPNIKTASILHRLQGHNGVIFSVVYDPIARIICSTSDDRTVRLWMVCCKDSDRRDEMNWKQVEIKLIRTMFGHTARVWRSIIKNDTLITIGEDSLICTWSLDGKLLNKICAHHGAAVWSIDISNEDKTIFTGGADGAVYIWTLANNYLQRTVSLPRKHTCILPKYVCYLSSGNFLIFNEDGHLFIFNRSYTNLMESIYLERYSTYCVMEVSLCRSYVCFASRNGYVTIYKETDVGNDRNLHRIIENKIMESQIYSLQWLQNDKLIVCGSNGTLKIFNFTMEGKIAIQSVCLLPPSRERWLTAAVLYKGLLVCGDRAGNMHVFELQELRVLYNQINNTERSNKPIQTFSKVHGKIGIQNFLVLGSKLISAGRDGMLRFYEKSDHENENLLYVLHREKMPMDWISGSLKTSNDTLILGFKEAEFVIYSMFHRRTIGRIPCGGGHRSWDCMLIDELITFLYIRNKQIYTVDFLLSSAKSPVLFNGFHAKEVYCIDPILKINEDNIFISGGEDGTLRITCVSNTAVEKDFSFRTLGIFDGHISSIKSMASLNLQSSFSHNKHLVFSGGGRAEIKVWEINVKGGDNFLQVADISCYDITSHMLYGFDSSRKKQLLESKQSYVMQPETRYMDIKIYRDINNLQHVLIFVACADGFVRIFLYDISTRRILLKVHVKCADRCIAKVNVLTYEKRIIALTMSTDGICRFIDFTSIVSKLSSAAESETAEFQNCIDTVVAKFNLHQSGINSYDLKMIKKDEYLLATGGDDNLFNLLHFKICFAEDEKELRIALLSKWNTSTIHYAQIIGIKFHDKNRIFSVGMDQQVVMHSYDYNDNVLSAKVLKKVFTFVTDVKGLTSWYTSKNESIVCVYGKGFELFHF